MWDSHSWNTNNIPLKCESINSYEYASPQTEAFSFISTCTVIACSHQDTPREHLGPEDLHMHYKKTVKPSALYHCWTMIRVQKIIHIGPRTTTQVRETTSPSKPFAIFFTGKHNFILLNVKAVKLLHCSKLPNTKINVHLVGCEIFVKSWSNH